MKKTPGNAVLLLLLPVVAVASYFLGRYQGDDGPPPRPEPAARVTLDDPDYWAADEPEPFAAPVEPADPVEPAGDGEEEDAGEALPPSKLLDALRQNAGTARGQKILQGMIADAARVGGAMLPEIKDLLDSGVDIRFTGPAAKGGFPSLRVALMEAAAATGDPGAQALVAEVAETTENPVELVFSAHVLDRLDALDAPIAQRTLDALAQKLTKEQRQAMGPILGKVIPAAAAADPAYAETYLLRQLRAPDGTPRAALRILAPVLDGLPAARAREIVLSTMTASDVEVNAKRALAGRAAQRGTAMLSQLRRAIESNALEPKVSSTIAASAMGGRAYSSMVRSARGALRQGDLDGARSLARDFQNRLNEARLTVEAARNAGARVNSKVFTTAKLHQQTLYQLRAQIAREIKRREKAAAQAKKN